jgi:hypothetical protein
MLAGVSASDLEALLEFVYRGEVSVDHSQLPSLLQAAQCLNIQGLAPQTVTHKDDTQYTSIQIHPGLVHQDVKTHILEVGGNIGVSSVDSSGINYCDLFSLSSLLVCVRVAFFYRARS